MNYWASISSNKCTEISSHSRELQQHKKQWQQKTHLKQMFVLSFRFALTVWDKKNVGKQPKPGFLGMPLTEVNNYTDGKIDCCMYAHAAIKTSNVVISCLKQQIFEIL